MNNKLLRLVNEFRFAIDAAKEHAEFESDISFYDFPRACCGDTSELLACYLQKHGYDTIYVCGSRGDQTHAWLVLDDESVSMPEQKFFEATGNLRDILNLYSGDKYNEPIDVTRYEIENVERGLIIDITADQFSEMKNCPVYIGYMDSFHRDFEFDFAHDYNALGTSRLEMLYRKISYYLQRTENNETKNRT